MKFRYAIVAGGKTTVKEIRRYIKKHQNIFWIAADSGAEILVKCNIYPDILVGDLDSISEECLEKIKKKSQTEIFRFPSEKDFSDTYLALQSIRFLTQCRKIENFGESEYYPADHSYQQTKANWFEESSKNVEVDVFGAIGSRLDHSLSNLWVAYSFSDKMHIRFFNSKNQIIAYQGEADIPISAKKRYPFFSIIPLSERVEGLTLEGFRYPLNNATVEAKQASLLISNELQAKKGRVKLKKGNILIIRSRD